MDDLPSGGLSEPLIAQGSLNPNDSEYDDDIEARSSTAADKVDTDTATSSDQDDESGDASAADTKQKEQGRASVREVFQFGQGSKKWCCLILGIMCSTLLGCIPTFDAFLVSSTLQVLSGPTSDQLFKDDLKEKAFMFMAVGAVDFVLALSQIVLLEAAAEEVCICCTMFICMFLCPHYLSSLTNSPFIVFNHTYPKMTCSLKLKWFDALLRQEMGYFDTQDVSGTAMLISTAGSRYKKGLGRKLGGGIEFAFMFFGGLAYAFYCSWKLSLVLLAVLPFMSASMTFWVKTNQSQKKLSNDSYAEAGSIVLAACKSLT